MNSAVEFFGSIKFQRRKNMATRSNKEGDQSLDASRAPQTDDVLKCGIVMPLSLIDNCTPAHWNDVQTVIREAVESIAEPKFRAEMVSQADGVGLIHQRIVTNLFFNEVVVCDVSCGNPNVMFELGMRLAFDKPVVIIKDDKTNYSFDTGPIEHLGYPRDLRYQSIQTFKQELAAKVLATYRRYVKDPGAASYLKSFGPIEVAKLETEEVDANKYLLGQLGDIRSEIRSLASTIASNRPFRYPGVITEHYLPKSVQSTGALDLDEAVQSVTEFLGPRERWRHLDKDELLEIVKAHIASQYPTSPPSTVYALARLVLQKLQE
jgi:hypothetical protein